MPRRKVVYRTKEYPFTGNYDVLQECGDWEVLEFRVIHLHDMLYEIYLLEYVEPEKPERYPRQNPNGVQR